MIRAAPLLILLAAGNASAASFGPRNAISLHPVSIPSGGIAAQYERFAFPPKFSLLGGPALRWAAGGDYSSFTVGAGIEGRLWISGRGLFDDLGERAMMGPWVAVRLDLGLLSVTDDQANRTIGHMMLLSESLWAGYRFTFFRHVELSFMVGTVLRHEVDPEGRIAGYTRLAPIAFGTTLGWMF